MAVLICGGAGYIGSHTAACLMDAGEDVIVYDSLIKGHKKAVMVGRLNTVSQNIYRCVKMIPQNL